MSIYEIEQAILDCIDPETGEISDFEKLEALNLEREEKVENIALWIKNLTAEAKAIRDEETNLADRRHAAERKAESLKKYLDKTLAGEKFTTSKVAISYRKSTAVEIPDEAFFTASHKDEAFVVTTLKVDKTELKNLLKTGANIDGAELVERTNIQIK